MAIDPICGMEVDEKTAKYTSEYNGEKFYFCAPGCKHLFEKEPGDHVGPNRKPFVPMSQVPEK